MTAPAPIYDLTLLLDPEADDTTRAKVVDETRATIESKGELVRYDDWGERPLAYPIDRRKSAEYHLLQFHSGDNDLLFGLERSLHITDGVLRFRLIKLKPGVGAPPDMRAASSPAPRRADSEHSRGDDGERSPRRRPAEAPSPPEAESEGTEAVLVEAAIEAPIEEAVEEAVELAIEATAEAPGELEGETGEG